MKTSDSVLHKISKIQIWFFMPLLLLIFNLVIGFNGLYGQDSFEYLRYSRALHNYLSEGLPPGNDEHEVLLIENLPDNWNLYEIRN